MDERRDWWPSYQRHARLPLQLSVLLFDEQQQVEHEEHFALGKAGGFEELLACERVAIVELLACEPIHRLHETQVALRVQLIAELSEPMGDTLREAEQYKVEEWKEGRRVAT